MRAAIEGRRRGAKVIDLLRRVLTVLFVVGLATSTLAYRPASAMTPAAVGQSVDDASMASQPMHCHHAKDRAPPRCGQACPWSILCAPNVVLRDASFGLTRFAVYHAYLRASEMRVEGLAEAPPARPPRT